MFGSTDTFGRAVYKPTPASTNYTSKDIEKVREIFNNFAQKISQTPETRHDAER